jgi:hypothetical protein
MNYARVGEEFGDLALEHAWKVFATLPLNEVAMVEHSSHEESTILPI